MSLKRDKVVEVSLQVHFPKVKIVPKLVCDVFSTNSRSSEGTISWHLSDIEQELKKTNNRLKMAEVRTEETGTAIQAASTLIKRLTQSQVNLELKLIDQEGHVHTHRDNLSIYGIPEDTEGTDIFLDILLKSALHFVLTESSILSEYNLALVSNPNNPHAKPQWNSGDTDWTIPHFPQISSYIRGTIKH